MNILPPNSNFTTATPDTGVDRQIEKQRRQSEQNLGLTSQTGGIDDRHEVAFDEGTAVAGSSPQPAEIIFQIGERTCPSAGLDGRSPECGRNMEPGQTPPAQHRQAAEEDEEHEGGVEENHHVGPELEVCRHYDSNLTQEKQLSTKYTNRIE